MTHRFTHYAVLIAVTAILTLPNLGAHSLWDMDEAVNVGCTREMMEAGTWVVPTFNWELRAAKPVFLYWVQRVSFLTFGISEWSARLPSVLFAIGTVLLTYELGRRMFGSATGFLGGIVLASALQFELLAHAATPDAPLIFFTTLTFYLVWIGQENGGRRWFVWPAVASGLAVLSKGPVGLALPALVVVSYLAWNRELRRLLDRKLISGLLVWGVITLPWYILVASETHGEYLERFLVRENVGRFITVLEGHGGLPGYYVLILFVFFAPWCCFLGVTFWYAVKSSRDSAPSDEIRSHRFLLCWILAYIVFFSVAATKLPNYVAPLYPALALLTARFLIRWQEQSVQPAKWVMPVGIGGVAIVGIVTGVGLLVIGGELPISTAKMRIFPGVGAWSAVGLIPLFGAGVMAWCLWQGHRRGLILTVSLVAVGWLGGLAGGVPVVVDRYKASKELVFTSGVDQPARDIRLGAMQCFQESMVFYAGRRVERLKDVNDVAEFLAMPRPGYVFLREKDWQKLAEQNHPLPLRVTAKKYDFYRNADIVVVTNDAAK